VLFHMYTVCFCQRIHKSHSRCADILPIVDLSNISCEGRDLLIVLDLTACNNVPGFNHFLLSTFKVFLS
jgi:hypothetical protein